VSLYDDVTRKFLCECGCEEEVSNPFIEYRPGHYPRSDEWKKCVSDRCSDLCHLLEDGYHEKMSKAQKLSFLEDPTRAVRYSEAMSGRIKSTEEIKHISESAIERLSHLTPEEMEERMKPVWAGQNRRPNKVESKLNNLLQGRYPNQWKYVGDGQVRIGGLNPDFINIDGKKAVIEVMGYYWHSDEDEERRKEVYNRYGFNCLVIWVTTADDLVLEWHIVTRWVDSLLQGTPDDNLYKEEVVV